MSSSAAGEFTLRDLAKDKLLDVTAVHLVSFPGSALSLLGALPIHRYYEWRLDGSRDLVSKGVFVDDRLVGFCFAGTHGDALAEFLNRNRLLLFLCLLRRPWLLMYPVVRARLKLSVVVLRRYLEATTASEKPASPAHERFGIQVIAVHPNYRRMGIGRRLMQVAEETAADQGFKEIGLTVDPGNRTAVDFYEQLDWHKGDLTRGWSGFMRKSV